MKALIFTTLITALGLAGALQAEPSSGMPKLEISFSADSRIDLNLQSGVTSIGGDRITARLSDRKGQLVATIQADRSELLEGKGGAGVVLMTGRPVVATGEYLVDAEEVQFDPSSGELAMRSAVVRWTNKNPGVLTYSCNGSALYRNGQRVVGDEDIVYSGNWAMVTTCVNGRPDTKLRPRNQVP